MGGEKTLGGRWGELGWKESYVFFHFQMREQGLSMFRAGDRKDGKLEELRERDLVGGNPAPEVGREEPWRSGWSWPQAGEGCRVLGEGRHEEAVGTNWYLPR